MTNGCTLKQMRARGSSNKGCTLIQQRQSGAYRFGEDVEALAHLVQRRSKPRDTWMFDVGERTPCRGKLRVQLALYIFICIIDE